MGRARGRHERAVGHRLGCRGLPLDGGAACLLVDWRRTLCFLQPGFEQSVAGRLSNGPRWVLQGVVLWR